MASLMVKAGSSKRPKLKNAAVPPIKKISETIQLITRLLMK
ncbi:Uncharacterised protein [Vibrio cholerae]|uniref:Uncharacterized protein n=1 Tax=Vibrio cholerae TaxID=666 RepID=A0A655WDS9_VIBCL|nr:hypothetical protein DN38_2947 [Vibrio cholerae]KKP10479.1 hypothetical protein VS85_01530 [Vibrio cholerae]CRZ66201.1 Uncharacterised protein [Vibrio cholerae]CSA05673.1 Uncharacterised protein [Vibrio cholerae]CSA19792.1 Uncharacterised protein [Vibrio cholerae]